ncbi:phosphate ABC transporter permease subunit PstC [Sulfuricurvum sp. IAE1]|jgi:phosphate transport system permease protein|uniref:phosphate ABC transporter permease subunit PstC n=1 Tax=Sulfuricurvum sp. IAE1 TaxID=2546102 RepID=UPI0010442C90|nr:phosphate ABC transporter permease subunit PstC [Sulfuricurvum sp. IAE1]MDD3770256.1 phosphate ABC transporter permease subunit PstC [Sulfuricurvum sp.]MDX9966068.1 phosphate ABC transporter permease subunit PstC [Sulfuricurvum sp.]TDA68415.1 phosphate ABC transporter permease subunit PstC [Sulfuricurvum sp. IAE1]
MLDKIFHNMTRFSALLILFIVAWIFVVLFDHSTEAMQAFGFDFIAKDEWAPNVDKFGAYAAIFGSVVSTFLAMLIAIPVAIGVAIFLSEIAHDKIKGFFGVSVELLAAIPSVIYGMWGLFYFVPIIRDLFGGMGIGLLSAAIVLSIMILPFMAAVTRDAMNTTPDILKESAYALGGTQWDVIKDIIIPYAKAGIIGSLILALGRAIGETMAVTFVMGNVHHTPTSILSPTTSIPVTLANEFTEADSSLYFSSLFGLALTLLVMSFVVIAVAKFYFLRKVRKGQ